MKTCTHDGCEKKHRAKGLCSSHYNQTFPTAGRRKVMVKCHHCLASCEKWESRTLTKRFCSHACREAWAKAEQVGIYRPDLIRKPRPMTPKRMWQELRAAIDRSDHATILSLMEQMSSQGSDGCWTWPRIDSDGYGRGPRGTTAHRLAVTARHGASIGSQPVHHKCANRSCVNPDHLQPVTHYDNAAEMLARTYMVSRIRALESALAALSPEHPLLSEIGLPDAL